MREDARTAVVAVVAVGTVDGSFRLETETAIDAIFAVEHPVGVEISFAVVTQVTQIAVPGIEREVAVVAVLDVDGVQCRTRHGFQQLSELFEERPVIPRLPELQRIPVITPPRRALVDGERRLLGIDRKNHLPTLVAFSMVEMPLVPPDHLPLQPAVRAVRRWVHWSRFKGRNNLLMQILLARQKLKLRAAGRAGLGHHASV